MLHQLASAPDGRLPQGDANKAIPKQLKSELQLTPAVLKSLRAQMVAAGWVTEEKSGRVVTLTVTEVGKQQLRALAPYVPLSPAKGTVSPPTDERVRTVRETYILDALARAPDRTMSRTDVAGLTNQHCLGLNPATARAVLTELALRGNVDVRRATDAELYALTASGAERLAGLRTQCPVLPPTGKPTPTADAGVQTAREAFLLLNLLEAPGHRLSATRSSALSYPKPVKLNHATAWQIRSALAATGQVAVEWDGEEGWYTLTPAGRRHLAGLSFDGLGEVKIKGATLTALLACAREGVPPARVAVPAATGQDASPAPLAEHQLEGAVMGAFDELLNGPYANLRMVPIHEIRKAIAERFGPAVPHAAFNDCLLSLRRANRLRLISIDDRSRATPEQLRDSIFDVGETFFYAEKAHAPA